MKTENCKFKIGAFDYLCGIKKICVFITSKDNETKPERFSVKNIENEDFNKYFSDEGDYVEKESPFKTLKQAIDWLESIGMEFDGLKNNGNKITDLNELINPTKKVIYENKLSFLPPHFRK